MQRTVAILGLSADPPHSSHLRLSEHVHALGYDAVWWMITPQNPDKHAARTPYEYRRELARLCIGTDRPWLQLSEVEAGMTILGEHIRTFQMLGHVRKLYPSSALTFVMGGDNWASFHTWGEFQGILDHAAVLAYPRVGWENLETAPATHLLAEKRDARTTGVVSPGCWRLADDFIEAASSTDVVRTLQTGGTPPELTPAQLAFIRQEKLYG